MTSWTAVVLAPGDRDEGMRSRLPTCLHPIAGRPLLWHAVAALATATPRPDRILVLAGTEISAELFDDQPVPIEVRNEWRGGLPEPLAASAAFPVLVADSRTYFDPAALEALLASPGDGWLEVGGSPVAMWVDTPERLQALSGEEDPLLATSSLASSRLPNPGSTLTVRTREDLGHVSRRVRDRLVRALMESGVTFLLPESTLVDVDVRIGRDSIVYPGVVLEGQTTVGDETVIGPGCRIIDSWVGSGVELKGWNYISRTSVRNRAILEPYVRRGFD